MSDFLTVVGALATGPFARIALLFAVVFAVVTIATVVYARIRGGAA